MLYDRIIAHLRSVSTRILPILLEKLEAVGGELVLAHTAGLVC